MKSKAFFWVNLLIVLALLAGALPAVTARAQDLEGKSVETADKELQGRLLDFGDVYIANGEKISLAQRTDWVAVAAADAGQFARLAGPGGVLEDFSTVQELTPALQIMAAPAGSAAVQATRFGGASLLQQVRSSAGVAWAAPVYVNLESGSWAVANDEVILAFKAGASPEAFFKGDGRFSGYRRLLGTTDQYVATLAAGGGQPALQTALDLQSDARLRWAAPNFYQDFRPTYIPNDPLLGNEWHLNNTGQGGGTVDADVDAFEAWDVTAGGSSSIVIAVVDDGMEYSHPDLAPNLYTNPGEIASNSIDDDGNGYVDDVNGWDFTSNDNFPGASSANDAHATSVGGVTAAAGDNGVGVTGMAYNARLLPVRIFGDTGSATTDANIAAAVYYAAGRTADGLGTWPAGDVMNNSWGGGAASTAITDAFTWATTQGRAGKGVVCFIANGNSGAVAISFPANLGDDLTGVVAVGASTNQDQRASYSQVGPEMSFVSPSSGGTIDVYTVDRVGANGYSAGDYTPDFGGTSSATPLAAGVGALLLSLDNTLTAKNVRDLMRNTTEYIGSTPYDANGFNTYYGYGRINAFTAVSGVGKPEIQVLEGITDLPDGSGTVSFSDTYVGQSQTRTLRIRNQGTEDLNLSSLTLVSPSGAFTVTSPIADPVLSVGEWTFVSFGFTPTAGGADSASVSIATNDADEAPFNFTLNGTGLHVQISGYVFEDWDGDGLRDSNDPAVANTLVYLDGNNNDLFDIASTNPASSDVPKAIPDNNPTGATSTLTVAASGIVADINITFSATHAWDADLSFVLISPSGTEVALVSNRGGSGDNFTNTTLDDEAATAISAGAAPFTGSFRPESPLSAFDGEETNGTWTLKAVDRESPDAGNLTAWSLNIQYTSELFQNTDSAGFYRFISLSTPATYAVRSLTPSGWNHVAPAGNEYSLTLTDPDDAFADTNYALARQNSIYGQEFNESDNLGVQDAGENGDSGWTVFVDYDDNGILDTTRNQFAVTPTLAIPDNNAAGVNSTQVVSGMSAIIDLNVKLNIAHTYVGDLILTLTSPAGSSVTLISRRGGTGENFTNTILDDEAATAITAITSGGAPFSNSYRPESPLSAFDGQDPNGTWTLNVADRAGTDTGTLQNWSLSFAAEQGVTTGDYGNYRIPALPGDHFLRQVNQAGWTPTAPASGKYTVTLASGASVHNIDFGNVQTNVCGVAEGQSYLLGGDVSITIQAGGLGNLGCLEVQTVAGNHPSGNARMEHGSYWQISGLQADNSTPASGFSVTLTVTVPFVPTALDKLCRYTGSGWDCAADSFDAGAQTITRANVTQFSDWVAGDDVGPNAVSGAAFNASAARASGLAGLLLALALLGGGLAAWRRRMR